ncbi:MAG: PAS domain S-box-containing protein/diguanylate cyclase (GGDEF)-like protein [Phenylobacterium sp.]|jgi:PAS domain S-box-containing protein/diguanylate cyclase (GGDEF)-like protein
MALIQESPCNTLKIYQSEDFKEVEKIGSVGGWAFDIANNTLSWSDETYRIYGISLGTPITVDIAIKHYSNDSNRIINDCFDKAINQHIPYDKELPFVDAQGKQKWIRTTGRIRCKDKQITHLYGAFEDITAEKKLAAQSQDNANHLLSVINNLSDAVVTVDEQGTILSINRATEKMFAYQTCDLIGRNICILMPEPYSSMHQQYLANYLKTGKGKIMGIGRELPAIRQNGQCFAMELSLSETSHDNQRIFIGIVRDISERKAARDEIFRIAYFDPTTDLPNRASFAKDLIELIAKATNLNGKILVSLIDIDRFSQVNLTYDYQSGNYTLNTVAKRLSAILPTAFKLYNNNGDQFFLLYMVPVLADNKADIIQTFNDLCSSILQTVNDKLLINEHSHQLTASIGSALTLASDASMEELQQLLKLANRKAKNAGGNRHVMIRQQEREEFERKSRLVQSIRPALALQQFYLVLQPQFNSNKQVIASEALLRWNSPDFGAVSPAEFIPLAEDNGDVLLLGDFVLKKVCELLSKLKQRSVHTVVAVNISAKQIVQPDFVQKLLATVKHYDVDPASLMLEITETTLVSDIELVKARITNMAKQGYRFSIDDFGTGYSSLSYLKELPINELKIDQYFIEAITAGKHNQPIVDTILQMAKALNLQVVAEGVETQLQFDYLKQHGCDIYQGFLLSRPLMTEQWLRLFDGQSDESVI